MQRSELFNKLVLTKGVLWLLFLSFYVEFSEHLVLHVKKSRKKEKHRRLCLSYCKCQVKGLGEK